jgi:hypothetical protein
LTTSAFQLSELFKKTSAHTFVDPSKRSDLAKQRRLNCFRAARTGRRAPDYSRSALAFCGLPAARFSSGFFNFPSLRTLSKIAARNSHDHQSEMTTNPTTHKPRATVKKIIKNGILKI